MKRKIVEVEWLDHALHAGQSTGLTPDLGLAEQESVGYFVAEDDDMIKIMMGVTEGKDANEVLVIDKRMVKSVHVVRRSSK